MILALLILYVCGVVLFTGMAFAFWQRDWPHYNMPKKFFYGDRTISVVIACVPIIGWLAIFIYSDFGRHGWLWPWSDKAYKEAGIT